MKKLFYAIGMLACLSSFAQKNYQIYQPNLTRNVILYTPKNFNTAENLPLVINMHGFLTTNSFQMDYTQFNKTADTARCIVAYPQGVDMRWNSGTFFGLPSGVDDVGFLSDVMDLSAVLFNVNMRRVYATGYSAGGFMSYKLACDRTNRVTAIAPNVASMLFDNLSSCVPARAMHISAFNGSADVITPYAGIPLNFPGIDSIKHFWQLKNNCAQMPVIDTLPDLQNDGTRVVRYTYTNCADNANLFFYKILNGGHTWPGANDIFLGLLGKTTKDINMNTAIWDFFKTKDIPLSVVCNAPQNLNAVFVTSDSVQLSWNSVSGVPTYRVALADDSDRVHFFETNNSTLGLKINADKSYRWNVASICNSGYHNWNSTRNLSQTPTPVKAISMTKISVFPNPATDKLYLEIPVISLQGASIIVYDVLGNMMYSKNGIQSNEIDISSLPQGAYVLELKTRADTYTARFIKSK